MLWLVPIVMQNSNLNTVYRLTTDLIFSNGGHDENIHEYYDNELLSISDDDNFCFYTKVMELRGFHELLRTLEVRIAFKETRDYAPGISGDFIVLKPIGKTSEFGNRNGASFDSFFHWSDMFIIRPRKLRETISVCGIRPSTEYRLRTRHGFETEEQRIYMVMRDRIKRLEEHDIGDLNNAIRWAVNEYHTRYGDSEYDIWSAQIPKEIYVRKDAAFEYGGYVVDAISPENLTLVNTIRYGEEHQNENIARLS